MSIAAVAEKLHAIVLRDLRTAARYRTGFVVSVAGTLLELAAFYYLSRAIGPGFRPEGIEYFPFLLLGTGLYTYMIAGMRAFVRCIQEAQLEGTLEVLMTSSTPAPVFVLLSATSSLVGSSVRLALYVAAGLILSGFSISNINWLAAFAVFGFSLFIVVGLGLLAAALQIAVQKGSAVLWIFGSCAWFLTGTLFPTEILPKPVQFISACIPVTHALTAARMALLQNAGLGSLAPEIRLLAASAAVLVPAGLLSFSACLRRARFSGTLAFY